MTKNCLLISIYVSKSDSLLYWKNNSCSLRIKDSFCFNLTVYNDLKITSVAGSHGKYDIFMPSNTKSLTQIKQNVTDKTALLSFPHC